jgi:hypothetical protein
MEQSHRTLYILPFPVNQQSTIGENKWALCAAGNTWQALLSGAEGLVQVEVLAIVADLRRLDDGALVLQSLTNLRRSVGMLPITLL